MENYYFGESDSTDWSIRIVAESFEMAKIKLIDEIAEGADCSLEQAKQLAESAKYYPDVAEEY